MKIRDKLGWPIETVKGRHFQNFMRRLIHCDLKQTLGRRNYDDNARLQSSEGMDGCCCAGKADDEVIIAKTAFDGLSKQDFEELRNSEAATNLRTITEALREEKAEAQFTSDAPNIPKNADINWWVDEQMAQIDEESIQAILGVPDMICRRDSKLLRFVEKESSR